MELHRAPGLLFQKLRGNKAQELSTTHIKVKTFTSGLCFNVHLDSMHPPVKLAERKGEGGGVLLAEQILQIMYLHTKKV